MPVERVVVELQCRIEFRIASPSATTRETGASLTFDTTIAYIGDDVALRGDGGQRCLAHTPQSDNASNGNINHEIEQLSAKIASAVWRFEEFPR